MDNLSGTASILWRGKYIVLAGLVLGILAATLATHLSSKVYQSTGLVQVASDTPTGAAEVLGLQQASQDLASTYATLITSRSFLARIRPLVAKGSHSVGYLAQNVNATAVTQNTQNTNLIEISAKGSSPDDAKLLAQQVALAFVQTVSKDTKGRAREQQAQFQSRISALTAQINALNAKGGATAVEQATALRATRAALTAEMVSTIASAVGREGAVDIVAPAIADSTPISPRPRLNQVLGAMLGLLVGIGAAWLRHVLDSELHSSDEVQRLVNLPVLASVPLRRGIDSDDLVTREAYDVLRTNLTFLSLEAPLAVLTVTSSEAGEGKSATAEGLAYAARRRDLNVLLIDGDLRTAQLSTRLGAGKQPGLVNVVAAGNQPESVIVEVGAGISLLPAGPTPPNPPSVLASAKTAKLVADLRRKYDLIVIDSPPVGSLADAAILAALSDASILVARAGQTDRTAMVAAAEALGRTPAPIVGVVVFERRSLDSVYYPAGGSTRADRPRPSETRRREPQPAASVKQRS